jgi:hypothetical protein
MEFRNEELKSINFGDFLKLREENLVDGGNETAILN